MKNKIVSAIMDTMREHSPEILISAGIVGMCTSSVLAVRATPKALELIEDKKAELGVTYLTRKEIAQTAWKQYIPAIGVGLVSASCIVLGTTQNIRRNTALATVYAISENTLKEYQRKTVEVVGEEKAEEIRREVVREQSKARPVIVCNQDSEYVTNTGEGDTLMFDSLSGRYFRSSMNSVDRAVNYINKSLLSEHYMTVNDLYNEMGIPTIEAGALIGWSSEIDMLDVTYDGDVDKNGNPYLIVSHRNRPRPLNNRYTNY